MPRIAIVFLFLLFQTANLFSQDKMKTIDQLVDSFLVKNNLKKIPDDMFVQVQFYKIKEMQAVSIQVTVADWERIEDLLGHYEMFKLYEYNLLNGQSVLFIKSKSSQVKKSPVLAKERLYNTDKKFLEKIKLLSSATKKRTDIFRLDYVYFLTPEHFHWMKIIDPNEEVEAIEAAEEVIEE